MEREHVGAITEKKMALRPRNPSRASDAAIVTTTRDRWSSLRPGPRS